MPWFWRLFDKFWKNDLSIKNILFINICLILLFSGRYPFVIVETLLISIFVTIVNYKDFKSTLKKIFRLCLYVFPAITFNLSLTISMMNYVEYTARGKQVYFNEFNYDHLFTLDALSTLFFPNYKTTFLSFIKYLQMNLGEFFCGIITPAIIVFGLINKNLKKLSYTYFLIFSLILVFIPSLLPMRLSFRWLRMFHLLLCFNVVFYLQSYYVSSKKFQKFCNFIIIYLFICGLGSYILVKVFKFEQQNVGDIYIIGGLALFGLKLFCSNKKIILMALITINLCSELFVYLRVQRVVKTWNFSEDNKFTDFYDKKLRYISFFNVYDVYWLTKTPFLFGNRSSNFNIEQINGYTAFNPIGLSKNFTFSYYNGFVDDIDLIIDDLYKLEFDLNLCSVDAVVISKKIDSYKDVICFLERNKEWEVSLDNKYFIMIKRINGIEKVSSLTFYSDKVSFENDAMPSVGTKQDWFKLNKSGDESVSKKDENTISCSKNVIVENVEFKRNSVSFKATNLDKTKEALVSVAMQWLPSYELYKNQKKR